jgi:hypothetical protein
MLENKYTHYRRKFMLILTKIQWNVEQQIGKWDSLKKRPGVQDIFSPKCYNQGNQHITVIERKTQSGKKNVEGSQKQWRPHYKISQ